MRRMRSGTAGQSKGVIIPIAILVIVVSAFAIVRFAQTSKQRKYGYTTYKPGVDAVVGERLGEALATALKQSGSAVIIVEAKVGDLTNARADTRAAAAQKVLEGSGVTVEALLRPTTDELRSFGWAGSMTEGMSAGYLASILNEYPGIKGIVSLPGYPAQNLNALEPLRAAGVKMVAFDEGGLRRYETLLNQGFLVAVISPDPDSEVTEADFDNLETQAEEAFSQMFDVIQR